MDICNMGSTGVGSCQKREVKGKRMVKCYYSKDWFLMSGKWYKIEMFAKKHFSNKAWNRKYKIAALGTRNHDVGVICVETIKKGFLVIHFREVGKA